MSPEQALRYATAAAAIQVTREGTATAMPDRGEVEALLATQGDAAG
jgi:ribokinase